MRPRPLRRVLAMAGPRRRSLAWAVAAGAAAAACAIALLATSGFLLSRAALQPPVLELMVAIVSVRAFGLGRGVFRYLERLATHDAALRMLGDLRVRFFQRLEPLAPGAFGAQHGGDLLARAVGDVEALQALVVRGLVPPLVAVVVCVPAVVASWVLLPAAGAVLAGGLALAGIALPVATLAASARAAGQQAHVRGRLTAQAVDAIQGAPELAANGRLAAHLRALEETDRQLARLKRREATVTSVLTGSGALVAGLTVWLTLAVAVPAVRAGALDGVLLAALALLALAAFEVVTPLAVAARQTQELRASARRLFAIADTAPPVLDPGSPVALPASPATVTLANVVMRYDADQPPALDGVSLELRPGRRVALVGPSGSGKTSVANVLMRFREIESGRMTVSGADAKELTQDDVRLVVGLAGQEAHLFDTTIAENVRLARPDATDDEVAQALAGARVWDWVAGLPGGMHTPVGERGGQVSGGQRQRIALARVLLAATPVVVLDEPFANLDEPTASALFDDLLAATTGQAVLLVTHRLAGLESFDEVCVLDRGRVVERGTHGELLAAGGLYRRLWDLERDAGSVMTAV